MVGHVLAIDLPRRVDFQNGRAMQRIVGVGIFRPFNALCQAPDRGVPQPILPEGIHPDIAVDESRGNDKRQAEPRLMRKRGRLLALPGLRHQRQARLGQAAVDPVDLLNTHPVVREVDQRLLCRLDERVQQLAAGIGLERRLGEVPVRSQSFGCPRPIELALDGRQMRLKESEPAFEDGIRTGNAGAGEIDGDDAAVRAPPAVQDFRCRPGARRLLDARRRRAANAERIENLISAAAEEPPDGRGRPEPSEQRARMIAALQETLAGDKAEPDHHLVAGDNRCDRVLERKTAILRHREHRRHDRRSRAGQ